MGWTPDPSASAGAGDTSAGFIPFSAPPPKGGGGGPFINWSSPASIISSPVRAGNAVADALGHATLAAGRGTIGFGADVGKEIGGAAVTAYHDLLHPSLDNAVNAEARNPGPDTGGWTAEVQSLDKTQPATGPLLAGYVSSLQHAEQLARAGGNTVLPGQPFGSNVGQLGSGAGLLGTTDYAHAAAKGGGGVLPLAIGDAANFGSLASPVEGIISDASKAADAEAAAHGETLSSAQDAAKEAQAEADANLKSAQEQAEQAQQRAQQMRAAAASGSPIDAAQVQVADSAASTAQQALEDAQARSAQVTQEHGNNVDLAQQTADQAQARAEQLQQHLRTVQQVSKLGSKVANSPFAVPHFAVPRLIKAAEPLAHAIVGTDLGQRFIAPAVERAHAAATTLADNAQVKREVGSQRDHLSEEKANIDAQLQRGFTKAVEPLPTVEAPVKRGPLGLFGTRSVPVQDPDAQAVATMAQTGESAHLTNLLGRFPRAAALRVFAEADPNAYTPEQLELAADTFGPGEAATEKAAALREAIPQVKAAYAKPGGALDVQNAQYRELAGEADARDVRPSVGAGAFEQVEHNIEGTAPRIEGLQQWQDILAKYDRDRLKGTKAADRAGKQLIKAAGRLQGLGLTPEEMASPRALFDRLYEAPTAAARSLIGEGPQVWQAMSEAPEKGLASLGSRVLAGKVAPDLATQALADQIIQLARKDPEKLSPIAQRAVEAARDAGMIDTAPRIGNVHGATAPAVRAGVGVARRQIGTGMVTQGTSNLERADTAYSKAMDRLGLPTRGRSASVDAAQRRVAAAAQKLGGLADKIRAATSAAGAASDREVFEHAGISRADVVGDIQDARRSIKAQLAAEAESLRSELSRMDVPTMKWPPDRVTLQRMVRKGEQQGRDLNRSILDPNYAGDIKKITESGNRFGSASNLDKRFFRPDGMTPDEIDEAMRGAHGEAGQATAYRPGEMTDVWLDTVAQIIDLERQARVGVNKGWEPGSDAANMMREMLTQTWGDDAARELGQHVVQGDPRAAADVIGSRLNSFVGHEAVASTQEGRTAAVQAALEADRANEVNQGKVGTRAGRASLDEIGKTQYDQAVAEDQGRVQGQVVGNRLTQASNAAAEGAETARAQGQSEGTALGRAQQAQKAAEAKIAQGDRLETSGARIGTQAPELQQEAAKRVAGPVGRMYREVGKREQSLAAATASYVKEQRGLERLDEKLAEQQKALEASVEAAPRPMRPVLELGERIRQVLTPLADHADAEFGAGAGDVYRNAAAEATILSADSMSRYGIDPQFLIGEKEGKGFEAPPERRSGGPTAAKTGQREAGVGLKHATDYETLYQQARSRQYQIAENRAAQRIVDAWGGKLGDILKERGVADPESLTREQLAVEMQKAKLSAWDMSSRRGGLLPGQKLSVDSPVVPTNVQRAWAKYQQEAPKEGVAATALNGYDHLTQTLKRLIRLTPRWQVSIMAGHAVMAMVGIGADPLSYFGHDVPAALRLDKMARTGEITDEDRAWLNSSKVSPQVRAALEQSGGFVPGAVRNRGFIREEFPSSEASRNLLGGRSLKFQSSLDNMHRTAVWIHQLERGLDAKGLADFREAYPDMAKLSDGQIQNEAAIRLSIKTMGDYLNKTPAERNLWSRIVYFYPWLKHITTLALRTAVHNPLRTAWLLHLGAMFDPGGGPLDFLNTSFNVGKNKWLTPPAWDPFEAIVRSADNPLGSVNPIVNTAVAGVTGYNLSTGKPVTRPASDKAGSLGLGELANFAANQVPVLPNLAQSADALRGNNPIVRYQTGQPILSGGRTIDSNENQFPGTDTMMPPWLSPLAPLSGVPQQRLIATDPIIAAELAKQAATAKAKASYERRRKAASHK